jgi:hypothetical protein
MMLCVKIAHVFLGTCESFTRLFLGEIQEQVGGYILEEGAVAERPKS